MNLNWALDLLLPKYCLGCGQEGLYLCPNCFHSLPVNNSIRCPKCERRSPSGKTCERCRKASSLALSGLLVASDWDNNLLRQLIYTYKYNFIKEMAEPLSEIMALFFKNHINLFPTEDSIIVPVPLHPRRLAWRGFNQSELLARNISKTFGLELDTGLIGRKLHTSPQADIASQDQRKKNVINAFKLLENASSRSLENKKIILIDDVCTTGSTINECAKILEPLKPAEIWGFVIARG